MLNTIINSTPAPSFSPNEYILNRTIKFDILTATPVDKYKYLLNDLKYIEKEFIYLDKVSCYQIPAISILSTDEHLLKFITTFRYINVNKNKFDDLRTFLRKQDMCLINRLEKIWNEQDCFNHKNLFTKKRSILFNEKNIIKNNNFLNKDYELFNKYKNKLKVQAIIRQRLDKFESVYNNSNKTIKDIQRIYAANGKTIYTKTIMKYCNMLNLSIIDNNRAGINYEEIIKNCILYNSHYHIKYKLIILYAKRIFKVDLKLITLKIFLSKHPEIKELIKKNNQKFIKKNKKSMKNNEIIEKIYNNELKNESTISYKSLLKVQKEIQEENGVYVDIAYITRCLKKLDNNFSFERKPKNIKTYIKQEVPVQEEEESEEEFIIDDNVSVFNRNWIDEDEEREEKEFFKDEEQL